MNIETVSQKTERYLATLEERIDELIRSHEQLALENDSLHARQVALLAERDKLIAQNEQSRERIEAMVARLKGLEQST
jgi:cell division protein ZapB